MVVTFIATLIDPLGPFKGTLSCSRLPQARSLMTSAKAMASRGVRFGVQGFGFGVTDYRLFGLLIGSIVVSFSEHLIGF